MDDAQSRALGRDDFQFARQEGATRIVVGYFAHNFFNDQPTSTGRDGDVSVYFAEQLPNPSPHRSDI